MTYVPAYLSPEVVFVLPLKRLDLVTTKSEGWMGKVYDLDIVYSLSIDLRLR